MFAVRRRFNIRGLELKVFSLELRFPELKPAWQGQPLTDDGCYCENFYTESQTAKSRFVAWIPLLPPSPHSPRKHSVVCPAGPCQASSADLRHCASILKSKGGRNPNPETGGPPEHPPWAPDPLPAEKAAETLAACEMWLIHVDTHTALKTESLVNGALAFRVKPGVCEA